MACGSISFVFDGRMDFHGELLLVLFMYCDTFKVLPFKFKKITFGALSFMEIFFV